jgi:hypothetical protein
MRTSCLLALAGALLSVPSRGAALRPRAGLVPRTWNGQEYACKTYYGDSNWPKPAAWQSFNASVDGKLLVDIPPGAPCYDVFQGPLGNISTYNEAQCADATANFGVEQWQ